MLNTPKLKRCSTFKATNLARPGTVKPQRSQRSNRPNSRNRPPRQHGAHRKGSQPHNLLRRKVARLHGVKLPNSNPPQPRSNRQARPLGDNRHRPNSQPKPPQRPRQAGNKAQHQQAAIPLGEHRAN